MRSRLIVLLVASAFPMLACGGGSKAQGGVGQSCYPNGSCNAGLSCFSKLCVNVNGDGSAGSGGASGSGGGSGAGGSSGAAGSGGAGVAGASGADGGAGATGGAGTDAGGDASDGAGTDAGATDAGVDGGFSVAALPGLALWLDAAKGITPASNMVPTWQDQSPNGNDAVQSGQGGQDVPGYVSGAVNGLPAVEFRATAKAIIQGNSGTAALGFGTGDFVVESVARWTAGTQFSFLFGTTGGGQMPLTFFGDDMGHAVGVVGNGGTTFVTSASTSLGNGAFHLVGLRRMGSGAAATVEVRVGGVVDQTATGANYGVDLQPLVFGQLGPGNALEIAEVVVVKGSTSADDLAHLEAYLKAKYGL